MPKQPKQPKQPSEVCILCKNPLRGASKPGQYSSKAHKYHKQCWEKYKVDQSRREFMWRTKVELKIEVPKTK